METRIDKTPTQAKTKGRTSGRSLSIPTTMRFHIGCTYSTKGVRAKVVSKSSKFVTLHFSGGKEPDRRCKLHMSKRIEICYPYGKEKGIVLHATDMVGGSPSKKKPAKKTTTKRKTVSRKKTTAKRKTTTKRKPATSSWLGTSKKKSDDKPRRTIMEPAEPKKRFVLIPRAKERPAGIEKPKEHLSFKGLFGGRKESGSAPAAPARKLFLDDKVD